MLLRLLGYVLLGAAIVLAIMIGAIHGTLSASLTLSIDPSETLAAGWLSASQLALSLIAVMVLAGLLQSWSARADISADVWTGVVADRDAAQARRIPRRHGRRRPSRDFVTQMERIGQQAPR